MRVDDECGLACVVQAARRRIDDVTLVSGAAPLRIALERGVRCPFGIYLVFSFNRPVIFPSFSPGIASSLLVPGTNRHGLRQAAGLMLVKDMQRHPAL
jgi:hypothetical protein